MATTTPDTCASCTRHEELDALFGANTWADIIGLQEVRRLSDNRLFTTPAGGKYTLFHTACEVLPSGAPNLAVGIMARVHLVPTLMSIRLLGPRLLVAKFRSAQRNLTVYVVHAPHSGASDEDRQAFYTAFSEALSDRNEMDTRVVLIDANTGPGEWRNGRPHIVGPHGIPFAKKG